MSQLNKSVNPQPPVVAWQLPGVVPEVEVGTQKKFWVALERRPKGDESERAV